MVKNWDRASVITVTNLCTRDEPVKEVSHTFRVNYQVVTGSTTIALLVLQETSLDKLLDGKVIYIYMTLF